MLKPEWCDKTKQAIAAASVEELRAYVTQTREMLERGFAVDITPERRRSPIAAARFSIAHMRERIAELVKTDADACAEMDLVDAFLLTDARMLEELLEDIGVCDRLIAALEQTTTATA